MPEAYYIIPMMAGPYSRDNKQRPDFVDAIQCNWVGHNVDTLGIYICKVNTTEAKHTTLAAQTGVRQMPRAGTWDTVISTLPSAARTAISTWCTSKSIAYDSTDTIGNFLMRVIQNYLFSLGATAQTIQYQNLTQAQKDKIIALCSKFNLTLPTATETVRAIVRRCGPVVWPGNDATKIYVEEF
jgi:hypothetical protein